MTCNNYLEFYTLSLIYFLDNAVLEIRKNLSFRLKFL